MSADTLADVNDAMAYWHDPSAKNIVCVEARAYAQYAIASWQMQARRGGCAGNARAGTGATEKGAGGVCQFVRLARRRDRALL